MTTRISTVDAEAFRETVFFSLTVRKWAGRKQVKDMTALSQYIAWTGGKSQALDGTPAKANNGTTKTTKQLLKSEPLDKLNTFLNETKDRLCGRFGKALPSRIKVGLFVVRKDLVQEFEDELRAAQTKLAETYVADFLADYDAAIQRAKNDNAEQGGLGPLWNARDYPGTAELAECFSLEWQWLALGVPEDLPAALRAEAADKLEKQFTEAAEEVKDALRVGFAELISHAQEKLTTAPGDKPKVFRDSLIGNIAQFCEVFNARNLMNDTDLAALVEKAKAVLMADDGKPISPDRLRKFQSVRTTTAEKFEEIRKSLDGMIGTKQQRKFDLDDE